MQPLESSTLQTLCATAANMSSSELDLKILVWDNSPGGQDIGVIPDGIFYERAPHNPGLPRAYNRALEMAEADGYEWLLTLDQDSFLPANFLTRITSLAHELGSMKTVGAIVPQVICRRPYNLSFSVCIQCGAPLVQQGICRHLTKSSICSELWSCITRVCLS